MMERREAIEEASSPAELARLQEENSRAVTATIELLSQAFRSNQLKQAVRHTERLIYLYSALEQCAKRAEELSYRKERSSH